MPKDKSSIDQVRSLVTELRILQSIGKHVNIVNLVAASVSRIAYGEIYVMVEFCSLGSLDNYLRAMRETLSEHSGINNSYVNMIDQDSTSELIYFSFQIARGMEYLSYRKVSSFDMMLTLKFSASLFIGI